MTPFERFGIDHLSPSSLNLFLAQPALWCGRYLYQWKDDFGPAAKRGTAVEAGLDTWLWEHSQNRAELTALDKFAELTSGLADDDHEKQRSYILPMLTQAMRNMPTVTPTMRQHKIETWIDGIEVPVIGYLDYWYDPSRIIDLKTTMRIPSELKGDHARQAAVYATAMKTTVSVIYVSDKKAAMYDMTPEQAAPLMQEITRTAKALRHALSKSDSADEVAMLYPPDFDNFRWSDETIKLARGKN